VLRESVVIGGAFGGRDGVREGGGRLGVAGAGGGVVRRVGGMVIVFVGGGGGGGLSYAGGKMMSEGVWGGNTKVWLETARRRP
jgi:hypothetical protein